MLMIIRIKSEKGISLDATKWMEQIDAVNVGEMWWELVI